MDRADVVHRNFVAGLESGALPIRPDARDALEASGLSGRDLARLFESQVKSRHLDRHARKLQARGEAFYTIGSSGHEGAAAIAAALRVTDMAFLHYRDAAFLVERSNQAPGETPLHDMMTSFTASRDDPISGGRHKVLGSKRLNVPPQTSTIASHLPKAMGAAFALGLARKTPPPNPVLPRDAIIYASFGDASVNHSTAQGAFNAAAWAAYKGAPIPILFCCEDNGIGISTPTPEGWVARSFENRPALRYFACDGLDLIETYAVARAAARYVRVEKRPAFLHMRCVRLYGHAGSDAQAAYMSRQAIEEAEANDPLLHGASLLLETGALEKDAILALYHEIDQQVARVAEDAIALPKLESRSDVAASLVPPPRQRTKRTPLDEDARKALFDADWRQMEKPQPMARLISWALADLMAEHGELIAAGEDIGKKGGVYGATNKLQARIGPARVIDTLLDEQSILGLGIGAAHAGYVAIPEIQFLAYLHNAEDQLRGEAATLPFFSNGQYDNPMVVRIAGLGYQRGFGGHFHNDNSINVLRDIPGLILACPSDGAEAVRLLRACADLAMRERRLVVFLEPIARYQTRDLYADGDMLWAKTYPPPDAVPIGFGEVGVRGEGEDLAIVTYGNGVFLACQAEKILAEEHEIAVRIVDLRWLHPLSADEILDACQPARAVLILDECRRTGSLSEELTTLFFTHGEPGQRVGRLAADDCFIPLAKAATLPLPNVDRVIAASLALRPQERRRSGAAP